MAYNPRVFYTPARMAAAFVPGFALPTHIQTFQRESMRLLTDTSFNRLIVEVSVRHGKSYWFSFVLPAWYLLTHPGKNVIVVAHTADLASEFVQRIRAFLRRVGPLVGRTLDPEQQSSTHVRILGGKPSELYAVGRGGSIAGRGCHLLIADDIIRDAADANSPTIRRATTTWWQAEAMTRLEPGGKVVIAMSRRHEEDLSGWCLAQNSSLPAADQWHRVRFPAIDAAGNALWPERYPLEKLRRIQDDYERQGYGFLFQALFQQDPQGDPTTACWPSDYLREDIFYRTLPPDLNIVASVLALDPSAGAKDNTGDYAALAYLLVDSDKTIWVDDLWLERATVPRLEDVALSWLLERKPTATIIEANGFQSSVAESISRKAITAGMFNPAIHKYVSTENKETRIRLELSPLLAQHRLRLRDMPSTRLALGQFKSFPTGTHDDAVDAIDLGVKLCGMLIQPRQTAPQPIRYA